MDTRVYTSFSEPSSSSSSSFVRPCHHRHDECRLVSPLGSTLAVAWHLPSWVEVRWHSRHCTLVEVDHRPWVVGALDHKLQVVELHRVEERHHSSWVVEPSWVEHRMAAVVDKLLAVVGNLVVVVDIHPLVVGMGSLFYVC